MGQRIKSGLLAASLFGLISFLFGFFVFEEIKWSNVIGTAGGGFIAWYFFIPRLNNKEYK
jgi:hypothetical protein